MRCPTTHPELENDLSPVVSIQIVDRVRVVSRKVGVRHGLAEGDSGAETTLALELDERAAHAPIAIGMHAPTRHRRSAAVHAGRVRCPVGGG